LENVIDLPPEKWVFDLCEVLNIKPLQVELSLSFSTGLQLYLYILLLHLLFYHLSEDVCFGTVLCNNFLHGILKNFNETGLFKASRRLLGLFLVTPVFMEVEKPTEAKEEMLEHKLSINCHFNRRWQLLEKLVVLVISDEVIFIATPLELHVISNLVLDGLVNRLLLVKLAEDSKEPFEVLFPLKACLDVVHVLDVGQQRAENVREHGDACQQNE
jgi:hypothetical protein